MQILKKISGDRQLWVYTILLMLFSFWAVYSASSNLANVYGKITPLSFVVKHFIHVSMGLLIIYITYRSKPNLFSLMSNLAMPIMVLLLLYTLTRGVTMGGANASRWLHIPMFGSLQPSTIAFFMLMMFAARFFGKNDFTNMTFAQQFRKFWIWVFAIVGLILPANLSTAALLFAMIIMISIIAGYPFKDLSKVFAIGFFGLLLTILVFKAFPNKFSSRIDTWQSRIEGFFETKTEGDEIRLDDRHYQSVQAKIAIAKGGLFGFRPGKSVQKNFLPQSVSDFIYAIIIEEYSLSGGLILLFIYLLLGLRIFIISKKSQSNYEKLLVLAVGFPLIFQALINMAVATDLFPVTGQPLPLVSSGGTAIWMTCFAIGVILSISRINEEREKQDLEEFVTE